jgi:hypothetical protein
MAFTEIFLDVFAYPKMYNLSKGTMGTKKIDAYKKKVGRKTS